MSDLQAIRAQLSLDDGLRAINAGSFGPLCTAAVEGARAFQDEARLARARGNDYRRTLYRVVEADRAALARVLRCDPGEVAQCESATAALNTFLWGLAWAPGDEVVYGSLENPAAWLTLEVLARRRGLTLVPADLGTGCAEPLVAILSALSRRTRLVLLSHVDYATGTCASLPPVAQLLRSRGILFLVDGAQALGTVPIDVRALGADGYAVTRHKFVCGPEGAGALFIRRDVLDRVQPTFVGVLSDKTQGDRGRFEPVDGAARFEAGTRPFDAIAGGTAALKWLESAVGLPHIFERVATLRARLCDRLSALPRVRLVSPRTGGALVSFSIEGVTSADAVEALERVGVHGRPVRTAALDAVRLSLGFWNRDGDVDAIADAIEALRPAG